MNHTRLAAAALASAAFFADEALALDQETLYTQALASTCANCHGTQGKGIKEGAVPRLAGLKSEYLIEQMQAFKSGARPATIMHQLAKGYSDEQIRLLATYFASQQP